MKLLKPIFLSSIYLLGNMATQNAFSFEHEVQDIGIEKVEAQDVSFEQSHLCPYPIELNVKVYNNLKIVGLKEFSYRWILNGKTIETNGRFEVYPSAYGVGFDIQKTIVHVGEDPENVENKDKENNLSINKLIKFADLKNLPNKGWYQFLVLPASETNWGYAVKSNKASYKINCKT